jgi:cytokinesis protein
LANILLVNAIVSLETVEQLESRISIRDQLNNSGLQKLLKQMDNFGYELLSRQIDRYQELADADHEDLYGGIIQNTSEDPHEILESLLNTTGGRRSYGFFVDMLQHMTLIPEEEESQ